MDVALLIARLIIGLGMAAHGAQKLFGAFGGPGLGGIGKFVGVTVLVGLTVVAAACGDGDSGLDPVQRGRTIFGVDARNTLLAFRSESPGTVNRRQGISGLPAGETIVGIDVRPADGRIYALGTTSHVYVVDTLGMATQVAAAPFTPGLVGTSFGWDVNPVADRIRVHADSDQDLRLNPEDGTAAVDSLLAFAVGDPNEGRNPNVVGSAYTNSVTPAPGSTVLYGIDSELDVLVTLPSPNTGRLTTVGPLEVDTGSAAGFDIAGDDGTAYAALGSGGNSGLYRINLTTGEATFVGGIDHVNPVVGIAVAP